MKQMFETLKVDEPVDHVMLITLNRPDSANALNTQMANDLIEVFEGLALDPNNTRAVVVTGSGARAFCAGGDLKERNSMSGHLWTKQHLVYERMVRAVLGCSIPVIGAINGAAYGGGCELACALDFVYASEKAKFAQTETRLGIIPVRAALKRWRVQWVSVVPKS